MAQTHQSMARAMIPACAAASDAPPFAPVSRTGGEPLSGGGVGPGPGSRCRPGALPRFAAGALTGLPPPAWRFGGADSSQDRLTAALCFADVPWRRWLLAAFASALSVCPHSTHRNRAWLLRFSLVQCPHSGQNSDELLAGVSMYFAPWRSHALFSSARCSPGAAFARASRQVTFDIDELAVLLVGAAVRCDESSHVHAFAAHGLVALGEPDCPLPSVVGSEVRGPGSKALDEPLSFSPFPRAAAAVAQGSLDLLHTSSSVASSRSRWW